MQFILTGFTEETGFRVFAFEATAPDKTRSVHTVRADLALTRRYGIQMQELPLLCRGLLDKCGEGQYQASMVYTEEDMRLHSRTCTEARNAAILKRKSTRRPVTTPQTGIGWRAPQPQRP